MDDSTKLDVMIARVQGLEQQLEQRTSEVKQASQDLGFLHTKFLIICTLP